MDRMVSLARLPSILRCIIPHTRHFSTQLPSSPTSTKAWIPNGAMKRGPKNFMNYWESNNGMSLWVLMPGVPKENVTVKVISDEITFQGIEVLDVPGFQASGLASEDVLRRHYMGSFVVDSTRFDAEKLKAEIVNGIFWIHVPKLINNRGFH